MDIWIDNIRRANGELRKMEEVPLIETHIPDELYNIQPGQIVVFFSGSGINEVATHKIGELFSFLKNYTRVRFGKEMKMVFTDNPILLDYNFAGINEEQKGKDIYKVVVGTWDSVAGFAAEFSGESIDDIISRVPQDEFGHISINKEKPVVVSIDPEDQRSKKQMESDKTYDGPNGSYNGSYPRLELLIKIPEKGSKDEKKLISKMNKKVEKVLRECAIYDIDPDIAKIQKKITTALTSKVDYKLTLDIQTIKEGTLSFCKKCEIYVANGENYKLDLTAVEKAVYLTFMLYGEGIRLKETSEDFREITRAIYTKLPDDDKCVKSAGGILNTGEVNPIDYALTLRGYISTIRNEVDSLISHPLVAQDYAIEGFKDSPFGIAAATDEHRKQIKEAFGL